MAQLHLTNLMSRLNVRVQHNKRYLKNPEGPIGRLKKLRSTVTALIKYERIEVQFNRGDEARGYAERLISEAVRYGDLHRPTMNLAKFWIEDEAAVPKLFQVLAPRYKDWQGGLPYTRMLRAPASIKDHLDFQAAGSQHKMTVLELRGNPYPPLPGPFTKPHPGAIHNVLLEEARKVYFRNQSTVENMAEQELHAVPVPEEDSCLPDLEQEQQVGELNPNNDGELRR